MLDCGKIALIINIRPWEIVNTTIYMIRPKKPTPVSIFTFLSRTILPLKAIKMLPWIFPTCSQDNRFSASNLKRFAWERAFYKLLLVWRSTFASIKFDLSSSDEWLLQQSASLSLPRLLIHTHTHMHTPTHTRTLTLSLVLSAVQKFEEKLDSKVPVRVPEERKLVASIRSIGLLLINR